MQISGRTQPKRLPCKIVVSANIPVLPNINRGSVSRRSSSSPASCTNIKRLPGAIRSRGYAPILFPLRLDYNVYMYVCLFELRARRFKRSIEEFKSSSVSIVVCFVILGLFLVAKVVVNLPADVAVVVTVLGMDGEPSPTRVGRR